MSPSRPNYGTARGRGSSSSTSTANTCRYENAISAATHTKLVLPSGECLSNPSELVVTPNKRSSQPQACSASSVAPATWGYLLQHKSAIALTELSTIFVCVPEGPTAWFDELLQGVGGTRTHLAARIVGNMDFAVADSLDKPLPTHAVVQVQGLFLLSMRMRSRDPDLSDALACYELTNAMTRACRALSCATDLSAGPPTDRLDLLDIMAESLCSMCQSAAAPEEMCEALDTGLLKFFFSCAANEAMPRRMRKLQRFLRDAIPQFTILHSVLCSLEDALDEIKHLDAAAHFKFDDELLKDWNALVQLAHERFQVLDQYAAGSLTARRACDNRQCWKIFPKTSMKRCGGCCIRHYCSRACQKTDYLARHRNACPILREYYEDDIVDFDTRDRSFFRALLNHDYLAHRREIAHKLLTFMRTHPSPSDVPCTYFDYRTPGAIGRCIIFVTKRDEDYYRKLSGGDDDFTAECGFEQGHGRMQFHVMRVFEEDVVRSYRLRLSSGGLLCGLWDVARRKPSLGVDLTGYREVNELLEEEIEYTH